MNIKPFSFFFFSPLLVFKLSNNSKVTTQVKRKLTYVFNVQSTSLNGRTVFAICYYIQILFVLFVLFLFFFVHALCNGDHNNIPKQAHEGGQMFSHDWNRIVQAMENKTDGKIPGNSNVGPGHM